MNWSVFASIITPIITLIGGGLVGWLSKDRAREKLERDLAMLPQMPEDSQKIHRAHIYAQTVILAKFHPRSPYRYTRRLLTASIVSAIAANAVIATADSSLNGMTQTIVLYVGFALYIGFAAMAVVYTRRLSRETSKVARLKADLLDAGMKHQGLRWVSLEPDSVDSEQPPDDE